MRFRNSFPRGMARGKRRAGIKARTEMTERRYNYALTRHQILAICDTMNSANQACIEKATNMTEPHLAAAKAIIAARAKADANLVAALVDGIQNGPRTVEPIDEHHPFAWPDPR